MSTRDQTTRNAAQRIERIPARRGACSMSAMSARDQTTRSLPQEYFVIADLCDRFACSRMWVTRHIAEHDFPKPIKFGGGNRAKEAQLK
jgi:hypothetical protein